MCVGEIRPQSHPDSLCEHIGWRHPGFGDGGTLNCQGQLKLCWRQHVWGPRASLRLRRGRVVPDAQSPLRDRQGASEGGLRSPQVPNRSNSPVSARARCPLFLRHRVRPTQFSFHNNCVTHVILIGFGRRSATQRLQSQDRRFEFGRSRLPVIDSV